MRQVRSLGRARGAEVRAETLAGFRGPYRRQLFEILGFVPRSPISRYCDGGGPVYVHECGDRTRPTNTHTNPAGERIAGDDAGCGRLSDTGFKRGQEGRGQQRGCVETESGAPDGRRWHPGCSAPGSRGCSVRSPLGSFCYPNVQNRRVFSFSLSLSSNVDLDEK